jgi:hypothetical protein
MRNVLVLLAGASLLIGLAQFATKVHAQSATKSESVRNIVEGNRLIRIEPTMAESLMARPVKHVSEEEMQQVSRPISGQVLRDGSLAEIPREVAGERRPVRTADEEIQAGQATQQRPGRYLVRVPPPGGGEPEVRVIH